MPGVFATQIRPISDTAEIAGKGWKSDRSADEEFVQSVSAEYGIRAMVRLLDTYQEKHGLRTVADMVRHWAPPNENDTGLYVAHVREWGGFQPGQIIDVDRHEDRDRLLQAMIRKELGCQPHDRDTLDPRRCPGRGTQAVNRRKGVDFQGGAGRRHDRNGGGADQALAGPERGRHRRRRVHRLHGLADTRRRREGYRQGIEPALSLFKSAGLKLLLPLAVVTAVIGVYPFGRPAIKAVQAVKIKEVKTHATRTSARGASGPPSTVPDFT